MTFTYTALPARVVFGAGSARTRLRDEVDALAATRVFVVAGEAEEALADDLAGPLGALVVDRFSQVRQHVPVVIAEAARARAREVDADLLVSIGGGSTTGTAKAIAMTTGLPILAVPTTYAGSEMTPVWGLTEDGNKTTGTDLRVLPRTVIYDPDLTLTLPGWLTIASGLNAMAHSVEAFWAPGANPVTQALAAEAIAALARGLPRVLADGTDDAGRHDTLYGAWLSGTAFAVAGSGLHHKICHALGGAFDLPHAQTHAVVLPHVLAFNEAAMASAQADTIANALAAAGGSVATAQGATARLFALEASLDSPMALRDVGLAEADLPRAIEIVTTRVAGDKVPTNPRPITAADVSAILTAAWIGARP